MELLLLNRVLSAEEALAWGLVNQVIDDADLAAQAQALAAKLAAGPTESFGATKRLMDASSPGLERRWRSRAGRSRRCRRIRTAAKGSRRSSRSARRNIREFRRPRRGTGMTDAFIFDHVRTPRGRGRPDGSLHRSRRSSSRRRSLRALRDRNALDTACVDDVVLGCVTPIGEQGADIARVAVLVAGFDETVPGKQLNRFCASGLEAVNTAAAQVMSGQSDVVIGGGVESMSRVPMGADGGAWAIDPQVAWHQYFVPQGISADLIATLDGYSRETWTPTRSRASAAPRTHSRPAGSTRSIVAGHGRGGEIVLDARRAPATRHDARGPGEAQASVRAARRGGGLRRRGDPAATRRSRRSSTCTPPATRAASSMAPRPC